MVKGKSHMRIESFEQLEKEYSTFSFLELLSLGHKQLTESKISKFNISVKKMVINTILISLIKGKKRKRILIIKAIISLI